MRWSTEIRCTQSGLSSNNVECLTHRSVASFIGGSGSASPCHAHTSYRYLSRLPHRQVHPWKRDASTGVAGWLASEQASKQANKQASRSRRSTDRPADEHSSREHRRFQCLLKHQSPPPADILSVEYNLKPLSSLPREST